jgi:hypothetical protein
MASEATSAHRIRPRTFRRSSRCRRRSRRPLPGSSRTRISVVRFRALRCTAMWPPGIVSSVAEAPIPGNASEALIDSTGMFSRATSCACLLWASSTTGSWLRSALSAWSSHPPWPSAGDATPPSRSRGQHLPRYSPHSTTGSSRGSLPCRSFQSRPTHPDEARSGSLTRRGASLGALFSPEDVAAIVRVFERSGAA